MLLDFATNGLVPNVTYLLDIPTKVGLERARAKSIFKNGDRMEQMDEKFHESVRHGFLKLAESISEKNRFYVIDAAPPKSKEEIHEEIIKHISKKLWLDDLED
jgi:dTMP kinase